MVSAGILALAGVAAFYNHHEHVRTQGLELQAVAGVRATQVGAWLDDRLAQARFAQRSRSWADLYQRWQDQGDTKARDELLSRAVDLRVAFRGHSVLLVDEAGRVVLSEDGQLGPAPAVLRQAVARALASGQVGTTGGYALGPDPRAARYDVVAPLDAGAGPAKVALVLRSDPNAVLVPMLRNWPSVRETAITTLVRRDGDQVVGVLGRSALPLSTPSLLAAQVFRGELPPGKVALAQDFRGVSVYGVAQRVPGTDWLIVAKIDRAEVTAAVLRDLAWIAAAAAVALLLAQLALRVQLGRRALERAVRAQDEQAARLKDLSLIRDIADSSSDSIFAKDRDGRYLLCNREAARLLGQTAEQVIGRQDAMLFPQDQAQQIRSNDLAVMSQNGSDTFEERIHTIDGMGTFLVTKGPLRDAAGQVVGLYGIARDITHRKRAERAMQDAARLVQAVEDSVLDHLAVLDRRGVIIAVNDAWRRFSLDNAPTPGEPARGTEVGADYLSVCRGAVGAESQDAGQVAEGIQAVLEGQQDHFSLEYPCLHPGRGAGSR